MEIYDIIRELQEELHGKKGILNKRVDLTRCVELIDVIAMNMPKALLDADLVVRQRENIYKNADSVARNIIKEAEERAAAKTERSEVLKLATKESKTVVDRTYRQCDLLVQKTKEHLDGIFSDVELFIQETLDAVKKNRDELRNAAIVGDKT